MSDKSSILKYTCKIVYLDYIKILLLIKNKIDEICKNPELDEKEKKKYLLFSAYILNLIDYIIASDDNEEFIDIIKLESKNLNIINKNYKELSDLKLNLVKTMLLLKSKLNETKNGIQNRENIKQRYQKFIIYVDEMIKYYLEEYEDGELNEELNTAVNLFFNSNNSKQNTLGNSKNITKLAKENRERNAEANRQRKVEEEKKRERNEEAEANRQRKVEEEKKRERNEEAEENRQRKLEEEKRKRNAEAIRLAEEKIKKNAEEEKQKLLSLQSNAQNERSINEQIKSLVNIYKTLKADNFLGKSDIMKKIRNLKNPKSL